MTFRSAALLPVLFLAQPSGIAEARPAHAPYHVAGTIAAPEEGSWDYARVNEHVLYVAHDTQVSRFDLNRGVPLPPIGAIAHAHAVVPLPGGRLLAVTSGHDASVRIIDRRDGTQIASIAVGANPDAALVDPVSGHLLSMDADAGSIAEIDVAAHRVVRTIAVRTGLEYAAIGRHRLLYVNNEDANVVEVIDLASGVPRPPIALPGCDAPTGLGYDAARDRLIAACANGQAAIVDASAARLIALVPIGHGPDAVLIDERRHVALIPCGSEGELVVLSLAGATVRRTAQVPTEVGARTGAIDPATGIVYLPTARPGAPATTGGRGSPLLGTFHIVVVRPS